MNPPESDGSVSTASLAEILDPHGFARWGAATIGPAQTCDQYRQWLQLGFAADMAYLHRHEPLKQDPRRLAPEAVSILAVAARYPLPANPQTGFSGYTLHADYHEVLRRKLQQVTAALTRLAPMTFARICVDSAPLLEREWAVRAGLGWIGKQGQVIVPNAGAGCVLGFLLTNLQLPASTPVPNRCGTCTRCRDACPTGAITDNHFVDARTCLSYWSIEHREEQIPELIRQNWGTTLFGCDRCTACCPWNRKATATVLPDFMPRTPRPTASECLALTPETFTRTFRHSAVFRTGLSALQRNARIALAAPPLQNRTHQA